ncbi:MAG: DUF1700 domain-containing protein [Clostridia bacterium]|nr:DUF1700 domain-containing protein [Clostridia bacterium]
MTKISFLLSLNERLSGLPKDEIEERLAFFGEMIEDRMEEGMSEEEAVDAIGSVDGIADRIISEVPLTKIAKEKVKPKRRLKTWEILLLAVGSPIWLSLLIAAFAVMISLYLSAWAVVVSLWSGFASLVGASLYGFLFACFNKASSAGLALNGAAIACAGLAIFMFTGCKALTKAILFLTKKGVLTVKKRLIKKEAAE